ncbi:MAG: 50S ribosomal protein L21 [Candidatus Aminicenantes bacterium]|nr:50S ribosomal protein L21 [Candidatus Aminicenantes bacterium]
MFAVIRTGGKQYVVKEGDVIDVEKLGAEAGGKILFEEVLLLDDGGQTAIGTPLVEGAVAQAEVVETFKDDKILVFKKKRRKQFRRTRGHRQLLTKVKIVKIYPDRTAVPAEVPASEKEVPAAGEKAVPAPKAAPQAKAPAKKPAAKAPAEPKAGKAKAEAPKPAKTKAKPAAKAKAAKPKAKK